MAFHVLIAGGWHFTDTPLLRAMCDGYRGVFRAADRAAFRSATARCGEK